MKSFLLHTLAGFSIGIGFVVSQLWLVGLFGLALLIYVVINKASSFLAMYWAWLVKSLLLTSWIWNIYPIDWIGFDLGWIELPVIGVYWVSVSLALACGGLFFYGVNQVIVKRFDGRYVYYLAPVLWLLSELVGSFAFSVLQLGAGSSLGTAFSMGYVGYLWSEHELLLLGAAFAGVYGLSILLVAFSSTFLYLYNTGRRNIVFVSLLFLVITSYVSLPSQQSQESELTVAVIETTLPTNEEGVASQADILQAAFTAAKETAPNYILFPEDARFFNQSLDEDVLRAYVSFQNAGSDAIVIDSGRVELEQGSVIQAAVYDGRDTALYQVQKRYLVPQGEYLPYSYSLLLKLFSEAETSETLQERLAYRVGPDTSQQGLGEGIPSILFCFEVVDPRGVRRSLQERETTSPFIAHLLSHAWIHHSDVFQKQLETMLRVQAIWNDTYIVAAANDAPSYTITSSGEILSHKIIATDEYWRVGLIQIPVR